MKGDPLFHLPLQSPEEWEAAAARTTEEWARVVLPHGWREVPIAAKSPAYGARAAVRGKTSLVFSAGQHDGKWWLHVSIAHPLKMPSYLDLCVVKAACVGSDRQAIHVFPKASEHVNIHSRALHMWACLEPEGDGLPAFGREGTI